MATFQNDAQTEQPALPTFDFTKPTADPAEVTPAGRPPGVRPNKYGAKCAECEAWVEEGKGRLDKVGDKWVVSHVVCPTESERAAWTVPTATVEGPIQQGRYTVVLGDDDNYVTLRVTKQDVDDQFMPGRMLVSYLSGADNDHDYTRFANVTDDGKGVKVWRKHEGNARLAEAVKVLVGDPDAAREAYALASERCSRCNRVLTVPASLHRGLGPECAKKAV